MAAVLTTASTLTCGHGGQVSLKSSQHKLTVDGKPVLLQSDLPGSSISNCATPMSQSNATSPCLNVVSVLGGASTTLKVGGTALLLAGAQGLTDGTDPKPGTWSVQTAGQTKLTAS